jgi:hypothetical protein
MYRWRHDDVAAVAAQIDALGKAGPVSDQAAGMRKIKMTPSPAGCRLDGRWQQPELPLQALKRGIATMLGINIKHDEIRYLAGDNSDVGVWPAAEPIGHLFSRWA